MRKSHRILIRRSSTEVTFCVLMLFFQASPQSTGQTDFYRSQLNTSEGSETSNSTALKSQSNAFLINILFWAPRFLFWSFSLSKTLRYVRLILTGIILSLYKLVLNMHMQFCTCFKKKTSTHICLTQVTCCHNFFTCQITWISLQMTKFSTDCILNVFFIIINISSMLLLVHAGELNEQVNSSCYTVTGWKMFHNGKAIIRLMQKLNAKIRHDQIKWTLKKKACIRMHF